MVRQPCAMGRCSARTGGKASPDMPFIGTTLRCTRPRSRRTRRAAVRWATWLAVLVLFGADALARPEAVTYAQSGTAGDVRNVYPLKLLQLALDRAEAAQYVLRAADLPMLQGRALFELAHGGKIRVGWGMTSLQREAELQPIRIPIFKGLISWRLSLVRSDRAELLGGVHELSDLRRFVAGQGHDWPDTEILRASGIEVIEAAQYDSLFQMLILGRFDHFPRSVAEIWAEEEQYRPQGLVIDRHLLIRYPSAFYFFVNKNDKALAEALRTGLERAIADGSFDRLFCRQYGPLIAQAQLERRTVIELSNPILPPETPLQRKELWFRVGLCAE